MNYHLFSRADKHGISVNARKIVYAQPSVTFGGFIVDESDEMIVMGDKTVIPKALQQDLLRDLLKMHQGATKFRQRTRLSVYWPNLDAEIANMVLAEPGCHFIRLSLYTHMSHRHGHLNKSTQT